MYWYFLQEWFRLIASLIYGGYNVTRYINLLLSDGINFHQVCFIPIKEFLNSFDFCEHFSSYCSIRCFFNFLKNSTETDQILLIPRQYIGITWAIEHLGKVAERSS